MPKPTVRSRSVAITAQRSTEDLHVFYDAEPNESDGTIVIRRGVQWKAHRKADQEILFHDTIATLTQDEAVALVRDLASSLRYSRED